MPLNVEFRMALQLQHADDMTNQRLRIQQRKLGLQVQVAGNRFARERIKRQEGCLLVFDHKGRAGPINRRCENQKGTDHEHDGQQPDNDADAMSPHRTQYHANRNSVVHAPGAYAGP
ncbi:hypothetical protein [Pseudomonas huanghezhanensis]|uniref:hypothetical protein n=1 Tax=Pseudomonas huanghezhanensis TaxID=3002903 RepID=UPI002285689C|nr:hypothetical protein [Pseudomonas sp. BSw22131]